MGADMTRGILLPIFSRVWLLILVSKPRAWFAVIVILLRIFGLILTIGWGILLFTRPYYYSWLRDYNLHKPRASYCLWPQGSISYQFNFQGVRYNNHDLLLDLITYHFRQAVLDCFENFVLLEWIVPGDPGGVTVILIIPYWRREVPIQIKHFTHTFSVLKDSYLIGLLYVILDIKDMPIKHIEMIFPHVHAQHKPQG